MSPCGQASLEYVAVVALVAAVLAAAAVGASATGIGERVTAQLVRALCVVTGRVTCDADRAPCPTGWRRDARTTHQSLVVVRLSSRTVLLREERSDGTVAMTLAAVGSGGVELGEGLRRGPVDVQLRAALAASGGSGTTWVLPDAAEADRWAAALAAWKRGAGGHDPPLGPASSSYEERSRPRWDAAARALVKGLGVEVSLSWHAVRGVRRDHATGHVTTFLRRTNDVAAGVRAQVRRAAGSRGWQVANTEEVAITADREGRPVELVLTRSDPRGLLPAEAAAAAALLPAAQGARTTVLEQRLDLAGAEDRRAAAAWLRGDEAPLRAALAERAVVHVRAYAVERDRTSAGGTLGVGGVAVGLSREVARERARIIGAVTRDLAGGWAPRRDCLA